MPQPSTLALYRNDAGKFTDVTAEAGLTADFYGQGVAVGDYDGDGDDDLFITAVGTNRLFRNDGGQFVDVRPKRASPATPTTGPPVPASSTTTATAISTCSCAITCAGRASSTGGTTRVPGTGSPTPIPSNFDGVQNYLYRNDGGRFTDVSAEAGIHVTDPATGKPLGKALAVTFVDFDHDGWLDVFVANDTVRHFLFRNRGDGKFEEIGEWRGFALNAAGRHHQRHGHRLGWIHNDDRLAVAVCNFADEMTALYVSQPGGDSVFHRRSDGGRRLRADAHRLSFGLLFDDFDLDGRVDLVQANGHLEETINTCSRTSSTPSRQAVLERRDEAAPHVSCRCRREQSATWRSRSSAAGWLGRYRWRRRLGPGDHAGRRPAAGGPQRPEARRSLAAVPARGTGRQSARHRRVVELQAGGVTQRRVVMPTRSYLSQTEPVVTFGLGTATAIESLTVTWPDGTKQKVTPRASIARSRSNRTPSRFPRWPTRRRRSSKTASSKTAIAIAEAGAGTAARFAGHAPQSGAGVPA